SVLEQDNGTVNVYVASGQSLVLGTNYMRFEATPNPDDPANVEVAYRDPTSNNLSYISNTLQGGDLGGALDFRKEILLPAIDHLGRLAVAISSTFNEQHQKGMDLNNNTNNDFFNVPAMKAQASTKNTGAATGVSIALSDVSALTTDEYQLTYDGANYILRNPTTNQVFTPGVASVTPPDTTLNTFNGMDITIEGGVPAVGDVFYVRPFRSSAREISLAIDDPNYIAAANPLRSNIDVATNLGDGEITQPTIVDSTDVNLKQPVTITFTNSGGLASPATADQFNVAGVGTGNPVGVAYVAGNVISYNGWEVKISGTPKVGDVFTIDPNSSGFSDNRNALELVNLQTKGTMTGGNATYHDAYSDLVVTVGNQTSQAEISQEAQQALLEQSKAHKESISGVNLDEEAANLLRYQQAYSAAAQVITIANSLFETLLGAVRG
ncbi:MAG: flagellar basal body rod C-terminal domain-containing protein, partial [Gammaproteobacteria bacterium]|nr:flagellar basal body rod C-terminal domain-containing protein [Gammaproteobacteria bacterium]